MDGGSRPSAERSRYRPARVRVVDHDSSWTERYAAEARLLIDTLGSHLAAIEHVGSTSVPGMPAKPIIDILAAVRTYDRFDMVVRRLAQIGYLYTPEAEADDPGRRVFRKAAQDMGRLRTHHLHITEVNSHYWQRIVAFRDHLRHHSDDATAYAQLKRDLAVRLAEDSRGCTAGKQQFVTAIERRAGVPSLPSSTVHASSLVLKTMARRSCGSPASFDDEAVIRPPSRTEGSSLVAAVTHSAILRCA